MRELLEPLCGQRRVFTATVKRFGAKSGWKSPLPTVLLTNIKHKGEEVTDHLWLTLGKRLASLELSPGDRIEFDARVGMYLKGYLGRDEDGNEGVQTEDYRLEYPTKVTVLGRRDSAQPPLEAFEA